MTRHDINLAVERFCMECVGEGVSCINRKCQLWECRTVQLAETQSIEVVSDAVLFTCQECLNYHGYCYDQECHLAGIPT